MRKYKAVRAVFLAAAITGTALGAAALRTYERIIALTPSSVETIYALGAAERLVGVSSFADFPPQARREKPAVGGVVNPDIEKLLSLRPDLIISNPSAMVTSKLGALGLNIEQIPDETLDDVARSFARIGELVGEAEGGRAMARRLITAVAAAREHSQERGEVSALVVIGYEPLWVAGGTGFLNEILEAAGGRNVAGAIEKDFYAIDFERVIAEGPECIIDLTLEDATDCEAQAKVMAFWRRFESIPAAASGRVEFIDSDLLTVPGPRLVDGVAAIEKALHGAEVDCGCCVDEEAADE